MYSGNRMAYEGFKHSSAELTEEQVVWLENLPLQRTVEFDGVTYQLVHEHPDKSTLGTREAYVFPRHFSNILPHIQGTEVYGLFLGHTHVRHTMERNKNLIHNPGSVGQPRDGTVGAVYTILDTDLDKPGITKEQVSYNIDSVISKVHDVGLPSRTGERIRQGE